MRIQYQILEISESKMVDPGWRIVKLELFLKSAMNDPEFAISDPEDLRVAH